tara:strand:+ start:2466 stop:2648 length:183 start_codon:yes stop_codon:yes gene_type:complete
MSKREDTDPEWEAWTIPAEGDETHQSTVEFLIEFERLKAENEQLRQRVFQLEERLVEALN